MEFSDAVKKWSLVETLKLIDQTPANPDYIYQKYFADNLVPKESKNVKVYIKKSKDVILSAIGGTDDRSVIDRGDVHELNIEIARFALKDYVTADEMNEIKSLDGDVEKLQSVSMKIGEIAKEHKKSYVTTLSYMAVGALFGEVTDGKGKTLFKFKNTATPIAFNSTKELIKSIQEIDDALVAEYGTETAYEIVCSRPFLSGITTLAKTEKLFEQYQAKWEEKDGKKVLVVYGVSFVPFTATRKNTKSEDKKFIADNTAIVVPSATAPDTFQTLYTRANHPQALGKAPSQFFMAEPKETDKGYRIDTEMRSITICTRPGALIPLVYS